jgi:uncharacterized membrane protein YkvA (DUF1232 family)
MTVRKRGRVAAFVMLARSLRASGRPGTAGIGAQLAAVPRMLRLGLSGKYPGLAKSRVLLALLGLLYIISPVDLIPDVLVMFFGLGLADDAVVAAWVAGAVLGETDAFLRWEESAKQVVVGEVIR